MIPFFELLRFTVHEEDNQITQNGKRFSFGTVGSLSRLRKEKLRRPGNSDRRTNAKLKKKLDPKGESPSAVQLERKLVAMWSSFNRNAPGGTAKLSL